MNSNKGMTLIEVLIASLILFTAVSAASLSYNSSLININKVNFNKEVMSNLPFIEEQVVQLLEKNQGLEFISTAFSKYEITVKKLKQRQKQLNGPKSKRFNNVSSAQLLLIDTEVEIKTSNNKYVYNPTFLITMWP